MTLHADAVATLSRWGPPDARDESLRRAYLHHLAEHPDAMWRECRPAHLTASALVVDPVADRVLLTLHPKVGRWLQTGGHCERGDPTLALAAAREATEESGLAGLSLLPQPVALDAHEVGCAGAVALHLDVQFVALAPVGAVAACTAESLALEWFAATALPADTDASVRRLVSRRYELTPDLAR